MRTVRRTDAIRRCPNAHKKKLNLSSLFDTIPNKISLCILATGLHLIRFLLLIIFTTSTIYRHALCYSLCYPLFLYSLEHNKGWHLFLPFGCYILYYMFGAQMLLQLHFVPHGEYTPSVVLCTRCSMFNCFFGLSAHFTQNISTVHLS